MEEKGVWRTVAGRRIFIKDGESLSESIKRSGKFKGNLSDLKKIDKIDSEIKGFIDEAKESIKKYGFGRVVINETKGSSTRGDYGKAENPANKELEKKLVEWGNKNGYSISFQTDKKNSSGVRRKLKYGSQQEKRTEKQRIMFVYKQKEYDNGRTEKTYK